MKHLFAAIAIVIGLNAFSQKEISRTYLDSSFSKTEMGNHKFYKTVLEDESGYLTRTYYASGKLFRQARCATAEGFGFHGVVREFWENGIPKEELQYEDGERVGGVQTWYETGQKQLLGYWQKIPKESSRLMISQFWDQDGTQKVTDGKGYYVHKNEDIEEEGPIENEVKVGLWKGKQRAIGLEFEETYDSNGVLISGTSNDSEGNHYTYSVLKTKPEFPGGMEEFYRFVSKTFKTPNRTAGGRTILKFVVNIDGTLTDCEVLRSIDHKVDHAALSMIAKSPRWTPGKTRGKEVKCTFTLPIIVSPSF